MIVRSEDKERPGNRTYLILECTSQVFIPQILGYYEVEEIFCHG